MEAIQIKTPTVKTTTVSVKNVMIGKRQLTQRVFKQIIQEDIFAHTPDNSLKGDAWGFVNYDVGKHFKHILWINKDGELRRCYVRENTFYRENDNWHKHWDHSERKHNKHAAMYLLEQIPQLFIAV